MAFALIAFILGDLRHSPSTLNEPLAAGRLNAQNFCRQKQKKGDHTRAKSIASHMEQCKRPNQHFFGNCILFSRRRVRFFYLFLTCCNLDTNFHRATAFSGFVCPRNCPRDSIPSTVPTARNGSMSRTSKVGKRRGSRRICAERLTFLYPEDGTFADDAVSPIVA